MSRLLVDPNFLYRFEREPEAVKPGATYRINDLELASRLSFFLILAITAAIGAVGVWQLQVTKEATRTLTTVDMRQRSLSHSWSALIRLNWVRAYASLSSADANLQATLKREMEASSAEISKKQKELEALLTSPEGTKLLEATAASRERYVVKRKNLLKQRAAGEDIAQAVEGELRPLADQYLKSLDDVEAHMDARLSAREEQTLAKDAAYREYQSRVRWRVAPGIF